MLLCRFQEIPLKIYKETLTLETLIKIIKTPIILMILTLGLVLMKRVRTINVNSPDIIEGEIVGKFQFAELGNLVKNSLGSLYTNFKANKVSKGQF
jgi:hypothetical protein